MIRLKTAIITADEAGFELIENGLYVSHRMIYNFDHVHTLHQAYNQIGVLQCIGRFEWTQGNLERIKSRILQESDNGLESLSSKEGALWLYRFMETSARARFVFLFEREGGVEIIEDFSKEESWNL